MQQQFQYVEPTAVMLDHVHLRWQNAGKEKVRAITVKLTEVGGGKILSKLHPKLYKALFFASKENKAQAKVEGLEEVLTDLVFPQMGPFPWKLELSGMDLTFIYGTGREESNIELADCSVKVLPFQLEEGGTTKLHFQVSTANIPDGVLDKLSKMKGQQTEITLIHNEKLQQQAIDGTIGHPGAAKDKGDKPAEKEAGDAFAEAQGAG